MTLENNELLQDDEMNLLVDEDEVEEEVVLFRVRTGVRAGGYEASC